MVLSYFDLENVGNNTNALNNKLKSAKDYIKSNPGFTERLEEYTSKYAILPAEVLIPMAQLEVPPSSQAMQDLCDEYSLQYCVQAANDWETVKNRFQTNKYNDDMTMNLFDIAGGLASTAFFYGNKLVPDSLEKIIYSEDGVREFPVIGKIDFQPNISKFADTQTSLWAVAAADWFDENAVIWSPFPQNETPEEGRTVSWKDPMGFYKPRGRVWAYVQQMNAYDRYLESGYTKEYAQSNIPINLSLTQEEVGEKLGFIGETKQLLRWIGEAKNLAGEAYAKEALTRVVQNLPVNYNRNNVLSFESLIAEDMPEYNSLVNVFGYTPKQAEEIIYANIGEPIKKPDEGSEINWTSIQKPNMINAFAGTRFVYSPDLAQDYEEIQARNKNAGVRIPYSIGRYEASKFEPVGSKAYNVVSGAIDAENRIISSLGLGAITKTIKKGSILAGQVDRLPDMLKNKKLFTHDKAKEILEPIEKYVNPFTGQSKVGPNINAEVFDYTTDAPFRYRALQSDIYKGYIKPAMKADGAARKKYGLLLGKTPKFLSNTVNDLMQKTFVRKSIQGMTEESNVAKLAKNPWLVDAPEEVLVEVAKSKTFAKTENIIRRALSEGYVAEKTVTPFILNSIPKGSSALTNAALKGLTGTDPGLRSIGSIAGGLGNKVIRSVDNIGKFTSKGVKLLKGDNAFNRVVDGTVTLNKKALTDWEELGVLDYSSNLGFSSAFTQGMSPYWTKKFSTLPGSNLSYKNRNQAFVDIVRHVENVGYTSRMADKVLNDFITNVRKTKSGGSVVDDLDAFSTRLMEYDRKLIAGTKGDYGEKLFKKGLEDIKNSQQQLKSFLADEMGDEVFTSFTKFVERPDGTKIYVPSLVKLSEAANNGAALYPVRRLNRIQKGFFFEVADAVDDPDHFKAPLRYMNNLIAEGKNPFKYGFIPTNKIENDLISSLFDGWNSLIFKPTKIIKQALSFRVGLEEQARFIFEGLDGIFTNPGDYLSWVYSYGQLPKRSRTRKLVEKFMDSGNDTNEILSSQYFSEAVNANWSYQGIDYRSQSVKGYNWVAVDAKSIAGASAINTQLQHIRNNPMSRVVARLGWGPELEAWARTREAKDMALDLIQETGDRYRQIVSKHDKMMEYLSVLEADIRMRTGHVMQEGVDRFKQIDGTFIFNHNAIENSGNLQIREALWTDKLLKHGGDVTNPDDYISMMPDMEKAPFVKNWGRKQQQAIYREIQNYIAGSDEIVSVDFGKVMMPKKSRLASTSLGRGADLMSEFWNTSFNFLLTEPLSRLNRSPAFKQYRYMYVAAQFPTYTKKLQTKYIKEFKDAKIPKKAIDELVGMQLLGQSGKTGSYRATSELASQFGLKGTQQLLYDASERHQLSEITRNIFPFPEVWFEMGKTWGRLAAKNPYKIREGNLLYKGLKSSAGAYNFQGQGWFSPDPNGSGDDLFLYPFNSKISNLVFPKDLGLEQAQAGMTAAGNIAGVNLLSTSLTPGPNSIVAFALNKVFDKMDAKMELREQFFGPFAPPDEITEAILSPPPFAKKLIAAGNPFELLAEGLSSGPGSERRIDSDNNVKEWLTSTDEYDSMRAETTIDIYSNIRAGYDEERLLKSGVLDKYIRYINEDWNGRRKVALYSEQGPAKGELTEQTLTDALLQYSAHKAKSLFLIRAIAQEILPTGFKPIFTVKDKNGKWWATQMLANEYNKILIKNNSDSTIAAEEFYVKYGIDHPYITTGSKESTDGTKAVFEKRNIDFLRKNNELLTLFPKSAAYLVPDNPEAERTYSNLWFSVTKRPDKFALQQNDSVAWFRYERLAKQIDEDTTLNYAEKVVKKRDARNALAYSNPGFLSNYGIQTFIPAGEIWNEIRYLWPTNTKAMQQPSAKGLLDFIKVVEDAEEISKEYSRTDSKTWWLESTTEEAYAVRVSVAQQAYKIIEKNPDFWYIWNGVFIKLYNNDGDKLEFITDMRDN